MKNRFHMSPVPIGLAFTLMAVSSHACSVCMGDPESKFAEASNAAIFLMLGVIGGVLGLLSVFALYLHRRSLAPLPPHAEVGDGLDAPSEGVSF
jgi:nitrate reductase gamma subunit